MLLRKIYKRLKREILFPVAWVIIVVAALSNRVRAKFAKDSQILDTAYEGTPILLLALYEKGALREDVENLLRCAKTLGVYTLCINTAKLEDPLSYSSIVDGYIERYNHGRDFGSYRSGFQQIFQRGWDQACPRLLMLNDSVFYTSRGLKEFLTAMFETEMEVLGATENHEVEYHLGSFCLSMSGRVVSHVAIRKYWQAYRNTDYRPAVIKKGEMALSKTLKSAVSTPLGIGALYNVSSYMQAISNDRKLLEKSIELARQSERVRWPRFDNKVFVIDMIDRYGVREGPQPRQEAGVSDVETDYPSVHLACDYNSILQTLESWIKESRSRLEEVIREPLIASLVEVFSQGSQIHQNAALLVYMGLPTVKLDGVYRGLFSVADVERITSLLNDSDAVRLQGQLFAKPYGGDSLVGWRQVAFLRWLV